MHTTTLRPELEPLPARMQHLPVDGRGYVVPWFVAWIDGKPEFRAMDRRKWVSAVQARLCWVCGQPLGRFLAFAIGPMCAVNRTTSEPACHRECAEWSARNCPFLSRPHMVRRENDLPEDHVKGAGFALDRNPGATCVWVTKRFTIFKTDAGEAGYLITLGDPEAVVWYAEGRAATRAEVEHSIGTGLPALEAMCEQDPHRAEAYAALKQYLARLRPWLPPATAEPLLSRETGSFTQG